MQLARTRARRSRRRRRRASTQRPGAMAHPRLPGVAAAGPARRRRGAEPRELDRLAAEIGAIIGAIGAARSGGRTSVCRPTTGCRAWFAGAARPRGRDRAPARRRASGPRSSASWRRHRRPTRRPDDLPLAHNDLGAEHVLVDPATLAVTGIIDWSDAARADPAAEVGRLLRDLGGRPPRRRPRRHGCDGRRARVVDRRGRGATPAASSSRTWPTPSRRRPDLVAFERASLAVLFAGC